MVVAYEICRAQAAPYAFAVKNYGGVTSYDYTE